MDNSKPPPPSIPPVLALYGGTFDPVHLGHTAVAKAVINSLNPQKLLFLPCALSPHKTNQIQCASAKHRLAMLQLACANINKTQVDDFELQQPSPSFTWRTLTHFHNLHPQHSLVWILGADQWNTITQWANPSILRRHACFAVVTRNNHTIKPHPGWQFKVIHISHPASSTTIRTDISNGIRNHPHLHPDVARYIATHQLYYTIS